MSKKQIMKKVFDNEFNVDDMRNQILLKNERKERKYMVKIFKYSIPACMVAIICGFLVLNNNQEQDNLHGNPNFQESLKTDLNIYKVAKLTTSDMDVKIENYGPKLPQWIWQKILEEFENEIGISKENFEAKIADKFISSNFYSSSIKGYKDANLSDEYKIHDYVLEYKTENGGKILIALCKEEKPLRDYEFEFKGEKSQIGNTKLEVSQHNNKYMAAFEFNNVNYNIETTDITENELLELLQSILIENTTVEDKDIN